MPDPSSFTAGHVERTGRFRLALSPADALPWFTPEGERAWAPDWIPEYLHPPDGALRAGLAFSTRAGGELTHWLLLSYDPARGRAEYVRMVPDSRIGTVVVECAAVGSGATDVTVTYQLTAVSEHGNAVLDALTPHAFEQMLKEWEAGITAAAGNSRATL